MNREARTNATWGASSRCRPTARLAARQDQIRAAAASVEASQAALCAGTAQPRAALRRADRFHRGESRGGFHLFGAGANQLQAMQMAFFFLLPSILLAGFMFPFRAMPEWAQWIGEVLPLTHFLRILQGILLKGSTAHEIAPNLWPIALFLFIVATIAMVRYRETLD
jgi:hypothetical protein